MQKECTGTLMKKYSTKEIELHYKQMKKGGKGSLEGYIKSGVVIKKEWLAGNDACEICKENVKADAIPLKDTFPSGHIYPPAGKFCRCVLLPVVIEEEAPPLPEGYSIESKWKGDDLTITLKTSRRRKLALLLGFFKKK